MVCTTFPAHVPDSVPNSPLKMAKVEGEPAVMLVDSVCQSVRPVKEPVVNGHWAVDPR